MCHLEKGRDLLTDSHASQPDFTHTFYLITRQQLCPGPDEAHTTEEVLALEGCFPSGCFRDGTLIWDFCICSQRLWEENSAFEMKEFSGATWDLGNMHSGGAVFGKSLKPWACKLNIGTTEVGLVEICFCIGSMTWCIACCFGFIFKAPIFSRCRLFSWASFTSGQGWEGLRVSEWTLRYSRCYLSFTAIMQAWPMYGGPKHMVSSVIVDQELGEEERTVHDIKAKSTHFHMLHLSWCFTFSDSSLALSLFSH